MNLNTNIKNILPYFTAKTSVSAPEKVISRKDAENYQKLGDKIGSPSDTIEVSVNERVNNKFNLDKDTYEINYRTNFDNVFTEGRMVVNQYNMTPKNYVDRLFAKWSYER